MHCVANIHDDLYWLGASDRRLAKFENVFPVMFFLLFRLL